MEHPGGDYGDIIGRLLIRVCEIHERVLTGGGGGLQGIRDQGEKRGTRYLPVRT